MLALALFTAAFLVGAVFQSRAAISVERAVKAANQGEAVRQLRRWARGMRLILALLVIVTWAGDPREAEELQRRALAKAEAGRATWTAAHARAQLARIAAADGNAAFAEQLYRQVREWSQTERPHLGRESFFLALAGSPATAAELGLAELGETALT